MKRVILLFPLSLILYELPLPKELIKNIGDLYGKVGKDWIDNLPCLLSYYAKKWKLTIKDCFNNANFNVVAEAI